MIIAIDGPAGTGKSTIAKLIAEKLNITFLNSGSFYRGITLALLKDNVDLSDEKKVLEFADNLDLDYVNRARKPRSATALRIMKEKGFAKGETAILGDQIYTDILCGVNCGIKSICVRPICISRNPLLAVRYFLEFPFRMAYKGN